MRSNAAQRLSDKQGIWRSASADPAIEFAAHDCLTLPTICKRMGSPIVLESVDQKLVTLALTMLQAGLLQDTPNEAKLGDVVAQGLTSWLVSIWGQNKYLDMNVSLRKDFLDVVCESAEVTTCDDLDDSVIKAAIADCGLDPRQDHVALVFECSGRHDLLFGEVTQYLESQVPGLGFEALKTIDCVGQRYGILGARGIEYWAQGLEWCGGNCEKEWARETGESVKDFDGITRAEFDEHFPRKWLKGRPMSAKRLKAATRHPCEKTRKVAQLLLQVQRTPETSHGISFPHLSSELEWGENFDQSILMCWKSFDMAWQLGDLYMQNDCGEYMQAPGLGMTLVPLDDPQWFAQQAQRWAQEAAHLRALDDLIGMFEPSDSD